MGSGWEWEDWFLVDTDRCEDGREGGEQRGLPMGRGRKLLVGFSFVLLVSLKEILWVVHACGAGFLTLE